MMTATITNQETEKKVKEGIDFLFSHFEGRQRLFPRKMSTLTSKGKQFTVFNKEQILEECIKSNFIDCRLNAYPVLEDGQLQSPNIIFIDLDLSSKYSAYQDNLKELEKNLTKILKIIKGKLHRYSNNLTILWTGNGYHIYIVLDVRSLELISEFNELSDKASEQFLRFAEYIFANDKGDHNHKPSFKSCLLRIPYTFNSKNGSEVKIIRRYDVNKIPSIHNGLLREFRLHLADIDIRKKRIAKIEINKHKYSNSWRSQYNPSPQYKWIEKLLQTPIEDGRKYVLWKILCPYLVNVKKLKHEQSYEIVKTWLEKCNNLQKLDFNTDIEIKDKLSYVKHYSPISMKKLKNDKKNLYLLLRQRLLMSNTSQTKQNT